MIFVRYVMKTWFHTLVASLRRYIELWVFLFLKRPSKKSGYDRDSYDRYDKRDRDPYYSDRDYYYRDRSGRDRDYHPRDRGHERSPPRRRRDDYE
jgi:hypothetical protein